MTSKPRSPGLTCPSMAFRLAPSPYMRRAVGVHHLGDLDDVAVEEAERAGERDHQRGDRRAVLLERGAEGVEIHVAVGLRLDGDDVEAGHRRGRGVGAVRAESGMTTWSRCSPIDSR